MDKGLNISPFVVWVERLNYYFTNCLHFTNFSGDRCLPRFIFNRKEESQEKNKSEDGS